METNQNQDHPLKPYSEQEKIDYLSILAYIANADGEVSDDEIKMLRTLAREVGISNKGRGVVLLAAEDPESVDVDGIAERLRDSELRFTLVVDMFRIAYSDAELVRGELADIERIAEKLGITNEQYEAIRAYADLTNRMSEDGSSGQSLEDAGANVAAALAAAGVPIAAVAASGSVLGLSAAGITSGLAALGLGLGMTGGLGVVAALGIGSYYGIKALYKALTE